MELVSATRRHLIADETVNGYVAGKVFKWELDEHVNGQGTRALVVRPSNGWGAPPLVGRSEYPVLWIECWSDASRDPDGNVIVDDAKDNAFALYRAVNNLIHGARDQFWGGPPGRGLRIITCVRQAEPFIVTARDTHGAGSSPHLPLGETAVVIAPYALHI